MSDPERDDDRPGGDETFDIDIEGFDDLNFHETAPADDSAFAQGQAMDLELEKLLRRLDQVVTEPVPAPESRETRLNRPEPEARLEPSAPAPIPAPPQSRPSAPTPIPAPPQPRPSAPTQPSPRPPRPRDPGATRQAEPNLVRPIAEPPKPEAETEAILLTERLSEPRMSANQPGPKAQETIGAKMVSQLTAQELADLIEKAVAKGFSQALAARTTPK